MQLTTSVAVEAVAPVLYRATSACMLINNNDVHVRDGLQPNQRIKTNIHWLKFLILVANGFTGLMRVNTPWNS